MGHHLKPARTNRINDLDTFFEVGDLELLLEEDTCLLVRRFDDPGHKYMIRR